MGEIIGIISIKGGVGKTTTVINLGTVLAQEFGKKILLVDTNFTAPNLGLHLGITEPEHTLHDALIDKIKIEETIQQHELGFHFIAGTLTKKSVRIFKLKQKLYPLREHYDIILLDSSPNLNDEILSTMIASDKLFVVTSPDHPTLSCTIHAVKTAKERNTPIEGLILNKIHNKNFELSVEQIEEATGIPVLAALPDDLKVLEALSKTTPASTYAPKREIAIEYKQLAAAILGENYKDPRLFKKIKHWFSKDVARVHVNRMLMKHEKT
ncbi:AAA family ATPase [Candidatus Woesearchaeota archaeon]|nr:AAA family ATPase [Candidatus Woesearchaeota archaeon]